MPRSLALLLFFFALPAQSAELFGVGLTGASRDQLRSAVKNAGIALVSEAGADGFFDVYESDQILHDSNHLYLGFVKKDAKFAFAEYEFNGLQQPEMLRRLTDRYGAPARVAGRFYSDHQYRWQSGDIVITLLADWSAYKTRLIYYHPASLQQLREERYSHSTNGGTQPERYLSQGF